MYASDRMKTFIRMCKDYDKNIMFRDCQMHFLNIYLRRKEILLIFFRHFAEIPADIGLLLRHKQILRETAKTDNSTLHGRLAHQHSLLTLSTDVINTASPLKIPTSRAVTLCSL